jgi:hypothetical protein
MARRAMTKKDDDDLIDRLIEKHPGFRKCFSAGSGRKPYR